MNSNAFNIFGICRKAHKLSMGHDACKAAVKSKKACLCLMCSDSSQRIYDEFDALCKNSGVPFKRIPLTIKELSYYTGYKAGVITVDDSGFAEVINKNLNNITIGEE